MLAIKIVEPNIRLFMNGLLREQVFDGFEVRSAEISHLAKFSIDGSLDRDFLPEDSAGSEDRSFCAWPELKPYVLNIIKGTKRPKSMKLVFSYPSERVSEIDPNASALFLNVVFAGDQILCTTAGSQKTFSMDKTIEITWDSYVRKLFETNGILYAEE